MKSQSATLAIVGTFALWAVSASAGGALAQGSPERAPAPEAASPEARGGTAAGSQRQDGRTPAEGAPARPEGDEAPRPQGGSCPDQGRKLELIV
jgi:hypothetical protein